MSHKIKLDSRDRFLMRGVNIPGYIWQERPFKFDPQDFMVGGDYLNEKLYLSSVQEESLERFIQDPGQSNVYGISSCPNDIRAKYFAAYLVQHFLESDSNGTVRWEQLYGGFDNRAMDSEPGLLVITGLTPNITNVKLEKARDLLEKHHNIPRIVVISGEDPITYFSTRLFSAVHNIYFHSSSLVKRKIEVV